MTPFEKVVIKLLIIIYNNVTKHSPLSVNQHGWPEYIDPKTGLGTGRGL